MRIYVTVTGALAALLTLAHIWRMTEETHLATDPFYLVITLFAAAVAVWAGFLLWRSRADGSRTGSAASDRGRG